ncbi:alpha/beta hydrolase domain-containing protein [Corynebacterium uterequi]|uniref:Alpha/beta hydrolase domain-containing protein n=1 Tax=Corynebacterium uterequi TaxID=1072256 RepID=A0A0G3HG57_9CORY|nr:alpha/beta hydrolase domain-containing protein [Corynebacterium uterequi]AKK11725.1 hypothetical protein CUTER_08720 [Corynebacterium uterequi]
MTYTISAPIVTGPLPVTATSYPFSTAARSRRPLDLSRFGFVEEEYLITGDAGVYERRDDAVERIDLEPYVTRVLVRRPQEQPSGTVWMSVLNASQGYDIEDDWRRAWNYIIGQRDTYVAVTAKPIQASALRQFDALRYRDLRFGYQPPLLDAEPGWDPFQTLADCEEGLAWDILAQTAVWVRSGGVGPTPDHVFLMGQSQSAVYTNTFLTYFHDLLRDGEGAHLFDGYLPGVGATLVRSLHQREQQRNPLALGDAGGSFSPEKVPAAQIDVPVISVTSDGDTYLFPGGADTFADGDGPLRRHWHIAGSPHSDARSSVIPDNDEVLAAHRLPRVMDQAFVEGLNVLPIEAAITASMTALKRWVTEGIPAAPSAFFDSADGRFLNDGPTRAGGVRFGMVANPIADFHGAQATNPVIGAMTLHDRDEVLRRFPREQDYLDACDLVDDALEEQGYLDADGRRLLRAVERELWARVVDGQPALEVTPQEPIWG